ncbi:MAG TPA: hypothetical protein VGO60_15700, partial [Iamia sp.]|nr:hypothetical protein [Iamia sp.]
ASCTDDGESTTAGEAATTTVPGETIDATLAETVCAGFQGTLVSTVAGETPDDDSPLSDALEALADAGPEPLRTEAQALLTLDAIEGGDPSVAGLSEEEASAAYEEGMAAVESLFEWALGECPTDEVVWGCFEQNSQATFATVGEAIGGDGDEAPTTTSAPGASTPEELYDEADSEGDPVEIIRTDDDVLVAWLDERGFAQESLAAEEDGGWHVGERRTCDDDPTFENDDFEMVGEEIPG